MSLLQMSISAAILTIVITVVRALTLNRLPKKTFLVLWGIVLLRLFVPVSIPSPMSIYTLLNLRVADSAVTNEGTTAPVPVFEGGDLSYVPSRPGIPELPVIPWQSLLWAAGFIACSFFFIISYQRCRRRFASAVPASHKTVLTWQSAHPARRTIRVMESDLIAAPLTYGILHPVILLPKRTDWENERQLFYVLTHEYVHIRRLDSLMKLLLTAALCIHWFNPLVWVMVILANRDIEMSCDETVVRSFGETTRASYARVLIGMEEEKSTLIPLSNSFSKNAIEERITAIMKTKKTSLFAVMLAIVLVCGISAGFATSADASEHTLNAITGTEFTQKEYDQLLALRFDGYEDMTVAAYQEKVWILTDTPDYMELLDRFNQSTQLYEMRDENETASFLFQTLLPLTAVSQQARTFSGYAQVSAEGTQDDPAALEYQVLFTVTNAANLTVGEFERTRQGVMEELQHLLSKRSEEELQDEAGMTKMLNNDIDMLKEKFETSALQFTVDYDYRPFLPFQNETVAVSDVIPEERQEPYGTEADYESALKLKTAEYENRTVADFNASLLDWANENYDRSQRIAVDAAMNDFNVTLTEEERYFITVTMRASNQENAALIKSLKTGKEKEDPGLGNYNLFKEDQNGTRNAWASLFYQLTYHITDEHKLTVSERDHALSGVFDDISTFFDQTDVDTLLAMGEDGVMEVLQEILDAHSSDAIRISFPATGNGTQFEGMSEPLNRE